MPLIGTRGAASSGGFGFTLLAAKEPYFLALNGYPSPTGTESLALDSNNNLYLFGDTKNLNNPSYTDALVVKLNKQGIQQYNSKKQGNATVSIYRCSGGAATTSNAYPINITLAGADNGLQNNNKLSSTGNSAGSGSRPYDFLGTSGYSGGRAVLNANDSKLFFTGSLNDGFMIGQIDTATMGASSVWYRTLKNTGAGNQGKGYTICIDESENVYAVGSTTNYTTNVLTKYNSSGTIQWQRQVSNSQLQGAAYYIDSVYVSGMSNNYAYIACFNTSGTLQWSRRLAAPSASFYRNSCHVDATGNVFLVSSGDQAMIIAKYNSSGTIQFQRTITLASGRNWTSTDQNYIGIDIKVGASNAINIVGSCYEGVVNYTNQSFIARLPTDGTLTGSYGVLIPTTSTNLTFTYGVSTYTEAAAGLSATTSTFTDASFSFRWNESQTQTVGQLYPVTTKTTL